MQNKISVHIEKLKQFGPARGCHFYLVTNENYADAFHISGGESYESKELLYYSGDDLLGVLERTRENSHIFVISPDRFVSSVPREKIGRRKLAIMAANSTPTSIEDVAHFIRVIEQTNPKEQRAFANRFFDALNESAALVIRNRKWNTMAHFKHKAGAYEWFEQGGPLDWSEQQIAPSGELSVLPLTHGQFSEEQQLALDGQIALYGYAILHNGKPSFLRSDQERLYCGLTPLQHAAVIADVRNGIIEDIRPAGKGAERVCSILEAFFTIDSRYQIIWEVGFGINVALRLRSGNVAMNEVYGGKAGILHWGLGLTPFTQYHLDIISPLTEVLTDQGDVLISGAEHATPFAFPVEKTAAPVARNAAAACPCLEGP